MEWVGGIPKDLEAVEKAARQVDGLQDVDLSDFERLLSRLNDAGWVLRGGHRPLPPRLFGNAHRDVAAIVAGARRVEDLVDVRPSVLEQLLGRLDADGWLLVPREEARPR